MKKRLLFLGIRAALAVSCAMIFPAKAIAQTLNTNYGKDFWFGYTSTADGVSADYVVYINSFVNTTGTISIPGALWSMPFTVTANLTTRIVVPSADVVVNTFGTPEAQAVHVVSNDYVAVFSAIEFSERSETTCVLPVSLLGNQYYILNYQMCQSFSEFMVVAQSCKDSVEITPSQNITVGGSHPAGIPYTVVLQPGQVYSLQCNSDLTGSEVRSLNHSETGVISASDWNCVFCNGTANPLYEETLPVNTWGKTFTFLPTAQAQDQCRVLAEQNGTAVSFFNGFGLNLKILNAGQYYDTTVAYSSPITISSNNPISVARLLRTGSCNNYYGNNPTGKGDPSQVMIDANEQMNLDSIAFFVSRTPDMDSTYIQVVTRTADRNSVFLDGGNIAGYFKTLVANPVYSYASLTSQPGAHKLITTGKGFVAYSCGLGFEDAFACAAGVYLKEINITSTHTAPSNCSASDATATANATGIPPFSYVWSNGQTNQTATGLSAGIYTVTVSDSDCVPHHDTAVVNISALNGYSATAVDSNPNCHRPLGKSMVNPVGGTSPYTYTWSNGQTNQTATGLTAGSYTCVVTDNTGCKCFVTVNITGYTQPSIGISPYNDSICAGTNVPLHVYGLNTNVYNWTPPNSGLSCYTCPTPTATPTVTTTYTVSGLDSSGCSASGTLTIHVMTTPKPIIKGKDSICPGYPDTLIAFGGLTYRWSNGGATTDTVIKSPAVTKTYTLTASNGPCTHDTTFTVHVVPAPNAAINPTSDSVCSGDSVLLTASGGAKYKWSNGKTSSSIWVKPAINTTYTLHAYSGTCSDSITALVRMIKPITASVSALNDTICAASGTATLTAKGIGGTATYKWSTGATTSSINVSPVTTTTYSVSVYGKCDTVQKTITVTVSPSPVIGFIGDTAVCAGKNAVFNASGGTTYTWNPPASGLSCYNCPNPVATPGTSTSYTLTVGNGKCTHDTVIHLTINNTTAGINHPKRICLGDSVTLVASGGGTYKWNTGATTNSITVKPGSTTSYTVMVNKNGCPDSITTTVPIDVPYLNASRTDTILQGDTVQLHATGASGYIWSPSTGLSCTGCPNPVADPLVTTTYTVVSTDSVGCRLTTTLTIYVETPCADFNVPNVFTPNDDGINDDFVVHVLNPSSYSIVVYDRWGKQMYTSTDATLYWNGRINGTQNLAPDGTYYYIIKATCQSNSYTKKGFVQLIGETK